MTEPSSSYGQILKSSALVGGAQMYNLLLGMVRTKFAATLIGPVGVGLLGNYTAIQSLVGTVAGLGIQSSGVREIAEAAGTGDAETMGRAVVTLRRICWLTGLIGALTMALLAIPISQVNFPQSAVQTATLWLPAWGWQFTTEPGFFTLRVPRFAWTLTINEQALPIAMLGFTLFLANLSSGQMALIQGLRRIGDLAKLQMISGTAGTLITIACYWNWGLQGILPALLLMAMVQLAASWNMARKVPCPPVTITWKESLREAGGLVRLGLSMMWSGLAGTSVSYITVSLITHQLGLPAVGLYGSAMALSGMFINFILGAMGADYYPRLTALANDPAALNRQVNEQTEIGLLLAVPGLLATLCLGPWIIRLFYTDAFLPAVDLLQWFILGCLGRVISWPLAYVVLALGKARWYFVVETLANLLHVALIVAGLRYIGIEGVAMAFFGLYILYTLIVLSSAHVLSGFRWSRSTTGLLATLLPTVTMTFFMARMLPLYWATGLGALMVIVVGVLCLQGLSRRLGPDNRIIRIAQRLPVFKRFLAVNRA